MEEPATLGTQFAHALAAKEFDRLVDQQAYLAARDGRIGWMRVLCFGFRPVAG